MTEKEIQNNLEKMLSKYFSVFSEVRSDDGKSRIDLVIIHKSDIDNECPVGIEVKTGEKKRGHELGLWLQQSSTYAKKSFKNYGKLIVCTYPQITGLYLNEGSEMNQHDWLTSTTFSMQNNVSTFLGAFKVGELQFYYRNEKKYYRLAFNSLLIWDEYKDNFRYKNYKRWEK